MYEIPKMLRCSRLMATSSSKRHNTLANQVFKSGEGRNTPTEQGDVGTKDAGSAQLCANGF